MFVIAKGSITCPDALALHLDDEMRVMRKLKAEGLINRRTGAPPGQGSISSSKDPASTPSENKSTPPCPLSSRTSRRSTTTRSTKSRPGHGNRSFARKIINVCEPQRQLVSN